MIKYTSGIYVTSIARSPIGKFQKSLSSLSSIELATMVVKKLVKDTGYKGITRFVLGNVYASSLGQNPSRKIALDSHISIKSVNHSVNMVCGSGMKAIACAYDSAKQNENEYIIAGGAESMSNVPYFLKKSQINNRVGDLHLIDGLFYDGLICSIENKHMGEITETIARKFNISREEQDRYAYQSHTKAIKAIKNGYFDSEIVPIQNNHINLLKDEGPRINTSIEALSKLKPVFSKNGTITAGNSSMLSDGAAFVAVTTEKQLRKLGQKPIARIVSYAEIGISPRYMGLGAYEAAVLCLKKAGLKCTDIDMWEINEAFACQTLAVIKLLKIDSKRVNIHGGAIALGHPIGASGARIVVTLINALKIQKKKYGLATLCVGGGLGIAMLLEII